MAGFSDSSSKAIAQYENLYGGKATVIVNDTPAYENDTITSLWDTYNSGYIAGKWVPGKEIQKNGFTYVLIIQLAQKGGNLFNAPEKFNQTIYIEKSRLLLEDPPPKPVTDLDKANTYNSFLDGLSTQNESFLKQVQGELGSQSGVSPIVWYAAIGLAIIALLMVSRK